MTVEPTTDGEAPTAQTEPLLLLFGDDDRNRRLLSEALGGRYCIDASAERSALFGEFDCCLVSQSAFGTVSDAIAQRRADTDVFLPFVLLADEQRSGDIDPAVWEYVDDVVTLPVRKQALAGRVGNLLKRRQTARELVERERELEDTVEELKLKERAIDEAPVGFTIADYAEDDEPLVYINEQFEETTGYDHVDTLGENCRFLQGGETDPKTVRRIREALDRELPVSVDIVNYRKHGEKFWNKLDLAPLRDDDGEVTHYVGFQTDITDRKVRERRMEVLNRVLSHNLRNKMNVIEAYTEILGDEFEERPGALDKLSGAASDLLALAETARETDRILAQVDADDRVVNLDERLQHLIASLQEQYPDVALTLTTPDDGVADIAAGGLLAALEEGIDNAAKHNDNDDPRVAVTVENRGSWVDIEIEDNGPGIPEQEVDVLQHGEEALRHADRIGIWLIYWTVTRAGGTMEISDDDGTGSSLALSVPTADGE